MQPEEQAPLQPLVLMTPPSRIRRLAQVESPSAKPEASSRLWVAVHLPRFTLDMATRGNPERAACVLVEGEGTRQRVSLANTEAARLGIRPGMPLGAAHALGHVLPFLRVPTAERQALQQLCAWAYQFTPMVAPVAPDGLVMEVRGSLGLFGGVAGLLARLRRELRQLGFHTMAFGTAPTPLAATWLARAHQPGVVDSLATLPAALGQVPLEVLDLPVRLQQDLCGIGLRTVGDCLRLPRDSLARRFTPELLLMLDQALGRQPDPRPSFELPRSFASRVDLLWEIRHVQALSLAMERLLNELAGVLRAQSAKVRKLCWRLHHADGSTTEHPVGLLEPGREVLHLLRLSREYFLRQPLHSPVRGIGLEAGDFDVEVAAPGGDLFATGTPGVERETWPRFVERLRARLGEEALQSLSIRTDHRPERAGRPQTFSGEQPRRATPGKVPASRRWAERPLWLTRKPVPLAEADGQPGFDGALELTPERERIEGGWWDDLDVARDYFVARNPQGSRLWVFRELGGERGWYLHGIFE